MARRSVISQLNRSVKMVAREVERSSREAERRRLQEICKSEAARKKQQRLLDQASRAAEVERKRFEKEAKLAHVEEMNSQVEALNIALEQETADLESLLDSTLDVDDYVDLESLRVVAEHPPFLRSDLENPGPPPMPCNLPPQPVDDTTEPSKVASYILGKNWRIRARKKSRALFEARWQKWQEEVLRLEQEQRNSVARFEESEAKRLQALEAEQARHATACEAREDEAIAKNKELDELIANLGYGTKGAVEEYISIVLGNSLYPEHFPVEHEFVFSGSEAELTLKTLVPHPESLNTIKGYKYVKARDEIGDVQLSQKARKDRYVSAVHQVALRTAHEVFEADRRGIIQTISLEVGTIAADPATGQQAYIPFVAFGVQRDSFMAIELENILPASTLEHLGASVSKNPFGLQAANKKGVRRSK